MVGDVLFRGLNYGIYDSFNKQLSSALGKETWNNLLSFLLRIVLKFYSVT